MYTMKIRNYVFDLICIAAPAAILLGAFALWSGSGREEVTSGTSPNVVNSAESMPADPFTSGDSFEPEDVTYAIRGYESRLARFSPQVAKNVQISKSGKCAVGEPSESKSVLKSNVPETTSLPNVAPPPPLVSEESADVWCIRTTSASVTNPNYAQTLKISALRWNENSWDQTDTQEFFESLPKDRPILLYVHGNRTPLEEAQIHALETLKLMDVGGGAPRPRLVIWAWSSDRVARRPRLEYYSKAVYADYQGFYLAWFLTQLENRSGHVTLVGHSFGARTILCAEHLLAGGDFAQKALDVMFSETKDGWKVPETTAILVAGAVDCDVLRPTGTYSHALDGLTRLYLTQNAADPALRFYPKMGARGSRLPEALGMVGVQKGGISSENLDKIATSQLEFASHRYLDYINLYSVRKMVRVAVGF